MPLSNRASNYLQLVGVFLAVKCAHFAILWLTPTTFDLSSAIYSLQNTSQVVNKLRHWDAVYFARLFTNGPSFEHEWVFSPLWWRLIRSLPDQYLSRFLIAIVVSNLSQLLSSFVLYEYTLLKIRDFDDKTAFRSSVVYLLSVIGVFGTAPYSENCNTLMTFIGLYLLEVANLKGCATLYVATSVPFSIAFWTRSNSVLLGFIYLFDFVTSGKKRSLLSGILFGLSILYYNYLPYLEFCMVDNPRPWCQNTVPSLFTYAQGKYWNNGFLSYWTPNNIPNFVISIPQLFLLLKSGAYFANFKTLTSLVLLNFVFCILAILVMNTQIVLRISTFMPLQFWYLSSLIERKRGQLLVTWMITWNLIQCALFAAFLPPA